VIQFVNSILIMSDNESEHTQAKIAKLPTALDQLKQFTVVVADTGDFESKLYWNY